MTQAEKRIQELEKELESAKEAEKTRIKTKLKTFEKMPQKKQKESIVEEINGSSFLKPNVSYGIFTLNSLINDYLKHKYELTRNVEKSYVMESYFFVDFNVYVWAEDGKIRTICCDNKCYWQGCNLIKMNFESFKSLFNVEPTRFESIYMLVDGKGQNQIVYDFDELGLQIWVWRKKIVTVLVSNFQEE